MKNRSQLPSSWVHTNIAALARIEMGQSPDSVYYNDERHGLPFFQVKTEFGLRYPVVRKWCSQPKKVAEAGDILLSIRAPVGPSNIAQERSAIGRGLAAIGAETSINQQYLFYFFRHIEPWLSSQGTGSTFAAISGDFLRAIEMPVAPAAEQTRIVEKLEELLSDLDAGVAELNAAQKKLAQYRQSLLKAAVEGALTADWRKGQAAAPAESGASLLACILTERRSRWETRQLAKFQAQGKTPPKDWQAKYPEPAAPDTAGLSALPEGWVWASLDQLLCELRSGTAATSGRDETGYPLLKSSAVRQGRINFDALNYLQEDQSTRQENYLAMGDVLITRLSGSVEYVGCCAVVSELPIPGIQYPDRVFCGKLAPSLMWLANFLVCCFQSSYVRQRVESAAKSSAGHKRISLSDLHPMPIPLPPRAEIAVILAQIDEVVQRIQGGERDVGVGLKQSAAQRKNILQAAFSGQLVPQDPADEPASVLLARIRGERVARDAGSTRGRGKKRGVA